MAIAAFVYILASKKRGTLYTGVTSNLERRLYQHRNHFFKGFTSKYSVTRLEIGRASCRERVYARV